ncbi:hypothetical protein LOK49_LG15G00426 [Camellia lanceoleosa]|uniref:Uncharacterized protein n=1 Tax=Camellia lanceoleosa TaxID=1840588 RepID=A0ACC0F0A3_9ERIC|nr:hypothetical protein LOK49_LG15G00426 [Camellia lanceoleosa]
MLLVSNLSALRLITVENLLLDPSYEFKLILYEVFKGPVVATVSKANSRAEGKALYHLEMYCSASVLA